GCTPIDAARPPSGMSPVSDTVAVDTRVGIAAPATPRCTGRRSTPTARHWRGRGLCGSQPSEADRPPPHLVLIVHSAIGVAPYSRKPPSIEEHCPTRGETRKRRGGS